MGFLRDLRASRAPLLAFVAMGVLWSAFAAQVPALKAQIGASDAQFGLTALISSLGAMAAMWLASRTDRALGAWAVPASAAAMALFFVLPGMTTGLVAFTAALLLVSAASGIMDVLMNARVAEIESETGRPLMNLNHAVYSFAYAGAALVTGWAREAGFGPVAVFGFWAALIVGASPFMWRRRRADLAEAPAMPAGEGAGAPIVWLAGLVVLAAFLTESSVENWSALHLERGLGGSPAQGAMGPAILGLTMGFGRLFGQALAARMRDTVMIGLACLLAAAGLALAALAPTLMLAYLGFGAMGLAISVVVPLAFALVGRAVSEADRVAAFGRMSVIGYGAFFAGPSLIGLTAEVSGLAVAFLVVSALLVATALLLVPLIARRSPATP